MNPDFQTNRTLCLTRALGQKDPISKTIPSLIDIYRTTFPGAIWETLEKIDYSVGVQNLLDWSREAIDGCHDKLREVHLLSFDIVMPNGNVRDLTVDGCSGPFWNGGPLVEPAYVNLTPLAAIAQAHGIDWFEEDVPKEIEAADQLYTTDIAFLLLGEYLLTKGRSRSHLRHVDGVHYIRLYPGITSQLSYIGVIKDNRFYLSDEWR